MTDQLEQSTVVVGPVDITVPSDPSLSRVVRLAASGLVSMAAFSIDEIEDVKLAVSEVMIALVEHGAGRPISLRFDVAGAVFTVHGRTEVESIDVTHPDLVLCRTVLSSVCAEHDIEATDGTVHIWATVRHPAGG
jgi:hypothetical protein